MDIFGRLPSKTHIKVNITNSKNDNIAFDIKFPTYLTVAELKERLQTVTAISMDTMLITIYQGDKIITDLKDDFSLLSSYPIESGMRFHVDGNLLCDLESCVEKFDLSDDQYENLNNTLRNYLKRNQLGKYNINENNKEKQKNLERQLLEEEKSKICTIGSRCQVSIKDCPVRRGRIMYNGNLEGKTGIFIGVQYDEPLGKNDGSINGKRYFTCPNNYGAFMSPLHVEVGDFPEIDYNLCDEI